MPITVVQAAQSADFGTTATFASGTTAGNTVVFALSTGFTGGGTITISGVTLGATSATLIKSVQSSAGGANSAGTAFYWVTNCAAAQTALAFTLTGGAFSVCLFAWEVSGLGATPSLDQFSLGSATTGTAVNSGTTPAITGAPELIVGSSTGFNGALVAQGAPWHTPTLKDGSGDGEASYQIATVSGGTYSWVQTAGNSCQWSAGVVTLVGAASSNPAGQTQPWPTVAVPHRRAARAQWRAGSGQAFVAVPAPLQEYELAPRRKRARVLWAGGQGQSFVAVPAPPQQPKPAPRRKLARAVIQFTPVTTTNASTVPVAGTVPALMTDQTRLIVRRDGRIIRR